MTAAGNVLVAIVYTAVVSPLVRRLWPWDWRGRPKAITIKRGRRPWE